MGLRKRKKKNKKKNLSQKARLNHLNFPFLVSNFGERAFTLSIPSPVASLALLATSTHKTQRTRKEKPKRKEKKKKYK